MIVTSKLSTISFCSSTSHQQISICYRFLLISSSESLISSHSGYHFAWKNRTVSLSDYLSLIDSNYCIEWSSISLLFICFLNAGTIPLALASYISFFLCSIITSVVPSTIPAIDCSASSLSSSTVEACFFAYCFFSTTFLT